MSPPRDTLPGDLAGLEALIAELNEELMLQRTIRASIEELPLDLDIQKQLEASKKESESIQTRLSAARKAHRQAETAVKPKQVDNSNRREFAVQGSNASSPHSSEMFQSRPATPARKRTYSHANITPAKHGQYKARRGNDDYSGGSHSSPVTALNSDHDDSSVIDLTGDDDEYMQRLVEEEQRHERNRQIRDHDATIARGLHTEGLTALPAYSSQAPHSSQVQNVHPNGTYFDRMIPHRASQTSNTQNSQASRASEHGLQGRNDYSLPERPSPRTAYLQRHVQVPAVPYQRDEMPRVPGAFVDSDEDLPAQAGHNNHTRGPLPSRQAPHAAGTTLSLAQAQTAAEAARRAAAFEHAPRYPLQVPPHRRLPPIQSDWRTQLDTEGFAFTNTLNPSFPYNPSQRPGYLRGGNSPLLQRDIFTSGRTVYQSQSSLGSIIDRTSGFDFENMLDGNGNPLDARLANYIHNVVEDPRKTDEEIQSLLSNIRPDMELPVEDEVKTPSALKLDRGLYPHQKLALRWMTDMEEGSNKGGILADDMGLGKTVSMLSLMVTRKSPNPIKTNLIVGPVALIKQWETEIRKKLKPEHRFSVFLFHSKKLSYNDMKTYDVVLTTYGKVASQYKKYILHVTARKQASSRYEPSDDIELQRQCPLIHPRSKFYRAILDEAQCIKNKNSQTSMGCDLISAEYRWCLTGTPMMNGVSELYPLIRFLKIPPYCSLPTFNKTFGSLQAKSYSSENAKDSSMQQLRIVLKAIMLRRMKDSTINGEPILRLPEKTETVQNCVFSQDEQSFYQQLETKSQVIFNKFLRAGTVGKNYSHVLVLLLRLRQACCHPHLNMDVENPSNGEVSLNSMEDFAKGLEDAVIARLKAAEDFECPICFDAVLDPTIFIPCGHDTCAECFTGLLENAAQTSLRQGQEGVASAKCPECRGEVLAKKVITYSVFKKVHMPETLEEDPERAAAGADEDDVETESDSDDETASEASDDDADSNGDLKDFIVDDDEDIEFDEGSVGADDDHDNEFPDLVGGAPSHRTSGKATPKSTTKKKKRSKKGGKSKKKADEVKPWMLKSLRVEANKNQEARKKYMNYLKKNWEPSAKTTKVCEILKDIEPTGEKTIIFSQWTAMLDLLEIPLKYELGIKYARYDGSMSRAHRDHAIQQFVNDSRVKVLLVSLRAGNAGLNLTVASHVIIVDPFWNPFIEMQAVDRAHRIGQLLPVQVHRVLVKGNAARLGDGGEASSQEAGPVNELAETVEDRIIHLQEQKRGLINAALDEGESRSLARLSEQELRYLFGMGAAPAARARAGR